MKKLLVATLSIMFLLGACGDNEKETENSAVDTTNKEKNEISDPIKFAKSKVGTRFYDEKELVTYEIIDKYTNNDSDKNGITKIDNNNFKNDFSYMLVKNIDTDEFSLAFFGEIKNDTDKALEFMNYIYFVTDTGEQLRPDAGSSVLYSTLVKEYEPGTKAKGYGFVPLDYQEEKPKQIGVTIETPADNSKMDYYGDVIKLRLATDGNPKDDVANPKQPE